MRIHLFELEDLSWFPKTIRNYLTDFLSLVSNKFNLFEPSIPVLLKGIEKSNGNQMLDIASGGGGSLLVLGEQLRTHVDDLKIVLSDYYPNVAAFERTERQNPDLFSFMSEPVDARSVQSDIRFRTHFLSFHHFRPSDAQAILQNAVDAGVVVALFEAQKRDLAHFIKFAFSPLMVLVLTPFIRPFRIGRLIATYLVPIVPICVFWDGLVSVLRTYTTEEMRSMTEQISGGDRYTWEIGQVGGPSGINVYLLGYPTNRVTCPSLNPMAPGQALKKGPRENFQ